MNARHLFRWTAAGVCRDTLRLATTLFAEVARPNGAQMALFQAWAPATRNLLRPRP